MELPKNVNELIAYAIVAAALIGVWIFMPTMRAGLYAALARVMGWPVKPDSPEPMPVLPPDFVRIIIDEIMRRLPDLLAQKVEERIQTMQDPNAQKSYAEMIPLLDAGEERRKQLESLTNAPLTPKAKP
jgi:hypothetical protein